MCRIDYADDDYVCLRSPAPRRARKPHKCDDCGRLIQSGETYTYGAWIGEYELMDVKLCAHCIAAGQWLKKVCGGHLYPGVLEELQEHWVEEPPLRSLGLRRLVFVGGKHWERNGELVPVEDVAHWVDDALAHTPEAAMA